MLVNGDSKIVVNRTISGQLMSIVRLSTGASLVENCMNLKWFSSKIGWVYWKLKLFFWTPLEPWKLHVSNSGSNWNCILKVLQLLFENLFEHFFETSNQRSVEIFFWYHKPSINRKHHRWWSGALFVEHIWVWAKIRYPNNWMVNTKLN